MESPPSTIDSNAPRQRELRTLVLNCLSVRSDRQLIAWAVDAFGLPAGKRPYTDYTTDFVCGAIFGHVGDSGASHVVLLRHRWLMSMEVRRIIFEPLENQHVPEYITVRLAPVGRMLRRKVERSAIGVLISMVLTRLGVRHLVRGHTVYASYTRLPFKTAQVVAASLGLFEYGSPLIG